MRDPFTNPFAATDADRHSIWEMLVARDIAAFLAADWSMVEDDFVLGEFVGIDGRRSANPDDWRLAFAALGAYRDEWIRQAMDSAAQEYKEDRRAAIFNATRLEDIEIFGERALAHKKFDGGIARADGTFEPMNWQTLYYCRKLSGEWKITGFTGYLPNPMG